MSEHKGLLVVRLPDHVTREHMDNLNQQLKPSADALGLRLLTIDGGADAQVFNIGLDGLAAEIRAQTEAIGQLAASNFALVQAIAQDGEMGDDLPPTKGLNGRPL